VTIDSHNADSQGIQDVVAGGSRLGRWRILEALCRRMTDCGPAGHTVRHGIDGCHAGELFTGHQEAITNTTEDLEARLDRRKIVGQGAHGLGFPESQILPRAQGKGEALQRPALQVRSEVDEHIPAEHEIDAGKWRAIAQVMLAEDDQVARGLADLVAGIGLDEVAVDQRW
jgi:hypothetical protein